MMARLQSMSLLALLLACLLFASPASAQSQTLYWQYTITNGTSTFGQWSVCAWGTITASTTSSSTNALKRPGFAVTAITGQRVFTNSQGSTVQNFVGLLGNGNANLNADDTLYVDYPHVDANGIAYLLDSPVIYGNGVFQVRRTYIKFRYVARFRPLAQHDPRMHSRQQLINHSSLCLAPFLSPLVRQCDHLAAEQD